MTKLKIITKDDALEQHQCIAMIYGDPGSGKTSLGFSSSAPLLLDFDHGAHRSAFRGDCVVVESWDEVANLTVEDFKGYDTVVVDTVGRQLDYITQYLISQDPRKARATGELTLQGFGALKAVFTAWIRRLQTLGVDIVLLSHIKEDKKGDDILVRPDIQGSSYGEVMKCTDLVGYLYRQGKQPVIDFSPSEHHVGKNAPQFELTEVPNLNEQPDFLGELITQAKLVINQRNAMSQDAADKVASWRDMTKASNSAEELTDVLNAAKDKINGDKPVWLQVRKLINTRASELDVAYDKQVEAFQSNGNEKKAVAL